jgi:DNA invertase Pin-like site-specific DNA recombinase
MKDTPVHDRPLAYSYIRMSTDLQSKGHSRQRQLEASADYAKQHGLRLVEGSLLEDIGVSAFNGANAKDGALGQFLKWVKAGDIPKGSYLIVESFDRISREPVRKAQRLFLDINDAGINVVTLEDNRVYKAENADFEDLIVSLVTMKRAHEESHIKSQRNSRAWANKRAQAIATGKPITRICPYWLKLNLDRTGFEVIKARAAVVKRIFEATANGTGSHALEKQLNAGHDRVPTFGKSKWWNRSYILKILANRAVLGEYQTFKLSPEGKRIEEGPPNENYFPRIIEEDLFYRAQVGKANRRVQARGRKGTYFTNLFSGLASCAYCGSRMTVQNKGQLPKGGRYLVCSAKTRGLDCVATAWNYDQFEKSFLVFVEQIDLPSLIDHADSERKLLDESIQSLEGQLCAVGQDEEKNWQLLQEADVPFLAKKYKELQQRRDEIEQQLAQKKAEQHALETKRDAYYESKDSIKSLIARLQDQTSKRADLYNLRAHVSDRIKAVVKALKLATVGGSPFVERSIAYPRPNAETFDSAGGGLFLEKRFFEVTLQDGNKLGAGPNKDNPYVIDSFFYSDQLDHSSTTK